MAPALSLPQDLQPLGRIPLSLNCLLLATMAMPHCLYAAIWERPKAFQELAENGPLKVLGANAVEVFGKLVLAVKSLQIGTVLSWCEWGLLPAVGFMAPNGGLAIARAITSAAPARLALGCSFLAAGQSLNLGIYNAIGKDGVYYGFKMGRPVPWATGFPFNLGLRHPQYVGSMLSWTGLFTLLAATSTTAAPFAAVLSVWTTFYCATSWHEASGDNSP
eukprot:TRINITY_DN85079_c0_g1_i1.p1 TRINITY_DN85079_c0_g1~~TRINITY_DN85079_c0_g1_i1.p1  ORF type:complete len:219 (-),score=22.60 TRINITY_DN85079_c0_g1_i1:258-914(-)